ncbi:hypothetical protein ACFVH6_09840 [Spirillospora sp. NPDC127200]
MTSATIVAVPFRQEDRRPVVKAWAAVLLAQCQPPTVAMPAVPCLGVLLR